MQTMPITSCIQRKPLDGISAGAASFVLETMEILPSGALLKVV
jgi:hypothetical protein